MLLYVHSSHIIMSLRSDPQRPKRPPATTRTTMLRRWGPRQCEATCVLRSLLFQQLCGTKSQRQCPKSSCWGTTQQQDNPSCYERIGCYSTSLLLNSPGLYYFVVIYHHNVSLFRCDCLVRFSFFLFVCLFVNICLVCLCVLLFVYLICLFVCII